MQPIEGKGRPVVLASHPSDLATHVKLLTPKQTLQRVPLALAEIKASNA